MTDFKNLFINVVVVGVLTLAIFSWVIIVQTQNNPAQLITNNSLINDSFGELTSNLEQAQDNANTASETFGEITPSQSFGIVDVTSVVSPTRIFRSLLVGTYNVLIELPIKILGVPPIIAGVIDATLFLLIILGIWAIWRGVQQ
jgi:hypothetical protein